MTQKRALVALFATCTVLVISMICATLGVHGQSVLTPPPYNPYPPGILPPDLDSEIARVRRDVNFIESQALTEWEKLPPPNVQGNPPTLQGSRYRTVVVLGKLCPCLRQRRLGACESASGVVSDWVAGCSSCLGWTCMELLPPEESCSASPNCHEQDT
jgi:hypothetical protein